LFPSDRIINPLALGMKFLSDPYRRSCADYDILFFFCEPTLPALRFYAQNGKAGRIVSKYD
jgi:hypothetical protein